MDISGEKLVSRIGELVDKKGLKRVDMYEIVPSGTLSAWKKGQEPRAYTICNLANFLGTSIDFLLTGKDKSSITSEEQTLLIGFRQLDTRDREDLLGNLQMKLDNAKKGDIISNSGNA